MEIGACGSGNLLCNSFGNGTGFGGGFGGGGGGGGGEESGHFSSGLYRHSLWAIVILTVGYLMVLLVGIVGNSIVIAIVLKTPRMRTVTNLFITNLAFADLLVLIVCLPPTLISNIYVPWILGWFLCKTVPYVQGVTVCASVYSLVAISMDRFLVIWFPLKAQITKKKAVIAIGLIWLWAASLALPWLLYFDLAHADASRPDLLFCVETWPNSMDGNAYFLVVNLIMFYLLPLGIISLCYFFIWLRVWRHKSPQDSEVSRMALLQEKSKVALLKMLMVVVFVFIICWLPLYVIFTRLKMFRVGFNEKENISVAMPIAQWLGASNSCINPILYAFFNARFRRAFFKVFHDCYCTCDLWEDMRGNWSEHKAGYNLPQKIPGPHQNQQAQGNYGRNEIRRNSNFGVEPVNRLFTSPEDPTPRFQVRYDERKSAVYFDVK